MLDEKAFKNFVTICEYEFTDRSIEPTVKIEFPSIEAQVEHSLPVKNIGETYLPERIICRAPRGCTVTF